MSLFEHRSPRKFWRRNALGSQSSQSVLRQAKNGKAQASNTDIQNGTLPLSASRFEASSGPVRSTPVGLAAAHSAPNAPAVSTAPVLPSANSSSTQSASGWQGVSATALTALTAADLRSTVVAAESTAPSPVVILGTVPSASARASIIGSAPDIIGSAAASTFNKPVDQATPVLCCGMCGYLNCPTQLLSQGSSNTSQTQLAGQSLNASSDFVSTGSTMGSSISATMSLANVTPMTNWNAQLPWGGGINGAATVPTAQLPGGGGFNAGRSGILTGEVTDEIVSPPVTPTAINPIVLENQKPGNPESEWGIDGAGDFNIEGFATDISVNHGNTISFKINTNSNHYRIDIYRLGYYGGMGARKVATIEHTGRPEPARSARRSRRPGESMPATGLFRHPGTSRRTRCRVSISPS